MPNQPKTPVSAYRLPPKLVAALKRYAASKGQTATDVVILAIEDYLVRQGVRINGDD